RHQPRDALSEAEALQHFAPLRPRRGRLNLPLSRRFPLAVSRLPWWRAESVRRLAFHAETREPGSRPREVFKPFILIAFNGSELALPLVPFVHVLLCSVCVLEFWRNGVNGTLLTTLAQPELSGTAQLARFFPDVQPVGPPRLLRLFGPGSVGFREVV